MTETDGEETAADVISAVEGSGGHPLPLPLAGVLVVACEQAVAAPFASRQLADLGARVIKIEKPGGDFARRYDDAVRGESSHFVWLNRSKESIVLDLKTPEGKRSLEHIVDRADVFLHNLSLPASRRLGIDCESVRKARQRLIYCSVSGYGESGPLAGAKAYDLLLQAETGLMSITGVPGRPTKAGIPVADIATGMYAFSGILTALYDRERTGMGACVKVSLLDSLAEWMSYPVYYSRYGSDTILGRGADHATIAPYGPFAAPGGPPIVLAVQNDAEWNAFVTRVLERPGVLSDPSFRTMRQRVANTDKLRSLIEGSFACLSREDVLMRLRRAGIAYSSINDIDGFIHHPQLASRKRWRDVETPGGPIRELLPAIDYDGRQPRMDPVPGVGEHTSAVLAEFVTGGE